MCGHLARGHPERGGRGEARASQRQRDGRPRDRTDLEHVSTIQRHLGVPPVIALRPPALPALVSSCSRARPVTPRSRHAAYGTVPITDSTGEEWASLPNVSAVSSARSARARRTCLSVQTSDEPPHHSHQLSQVGGTYSASRPPWEILGPAGICRETGRKGPVVASVTNSTGLDLATTDGRRKGSPREPDPRCHPRRRHLRGRLRGPRRPRLLSGGDRSQGRGRPLRGHGEPGQGPTEVAPPRPGAAARARPRRGAGGRDGERDQLQHRLDLDLRAGAHVRLPRALRPTLATLGSPRPAVPHRRLRPLRRGAQDRTRSPPLVAR